MTTDLAQAHRAALENTQRIVDGISPEDLRLPTPCAGWDVEELLHHVVYGNWWVAPLVAGETIDEVGDRFEGNILGDDLGKAYAESAASAAAAFLAPGAMDAPCAVSYGPVPGSMYCGHRLIDVVVHGWDLAKATGGDTSLPAELVEACIEVTLPQKDLLAGSGMFGDAVDPGDAVAPQARLLALLGRSD